jgi:hypothetical protein
MIGEIADHPLFFNLERRFLVNSGQQIEVSLPGIQKIIYFCVA